MTNPDKPGTDWAAKHQSAGTNADQPQHPNHTTADGPLQQHTHPMGDDWLMNRLEQTT